MKNKIAIIILFEFSLGLHAQDNLNFFKFTPETLSFNKPETKILSISKDDYDLSKQRVIKIKTLDDKEYSKKSDSIKNIFKTECPSIFSDSDCIQLNTYDNVVNKYCANTKPLDEKEYLNFYFVGIDNKLGTVCVSPYEGTTFYVIDLKS